MNIFIIIEMIGGLALFLFGMNELSENLETNLSGKLQSILSKLTDNPFKGLILGAGVTAIIQSSSATTVVVVGLVNSGVMKFKQAIGVIMGANIGTTITAWVLSLTGISGSNIFVEFLKPKNFSPVIAIVCIGFFMFSKNDKVRNVISVLMSFAILMIGMSIMSDAVSPLADDPNFAKLFTMFQDNPILGILVGAFVTAIIQSSSASVGILQALSLTGAISFYAAIPIIMGQNIGTTVTALISSIGTNKNARRTAMLHLFFNVIGTIILCSLFYILNAIFHFEFLNEKIGVLGIAICHSLFNILCVVILFPARNLLEKLATISVPEKKGTEEEYEILDERLIEVPSLAISNAERVAMISLKAAKKSVLLAIELLKNFDETVSKKIMKTEKDTDYYEDKLGKYLIRITKENLTENDSIHISKLLFVASFSEQIADEAENILDSAKEISTKKIKFAPDVEKCIETISEAIKEVLDKAYSLYVERNVELYYEVEAIEDSVDDLKEALKIKNMDWIRDGVLTTEQGFIFEDIISTLEHISDDAAGLANLVRHYDLGNFGRHKNLHTEENEFYQKKYSEYQKKYNVE